MELVKLKGEALSSDFLSSQRTGKIDHTEKREARQILEKLI